MGPKTLGRYEIEAEIGQGAMGVVYRARDPLVGRTVAIKAIKEEILRQEGSDDYLRRFQREARAAGGLSHPNILTIFDVGDNYFVMEYLEGENLLENLARRTRLPLAEVNSIISPLVDALEYAHRRGVYHRDIKPANIMVLKDGTPKLMDFGLAHLESTVMTSTGQFLGSPSYMSPEQIKGDALTSQADLFSLAVVTYEMLTGNKPFPGESITTVVYRVMNEEPVPPRRWVTELPAQYDEIFRRALAKTPEDRYAHFGDFLTALNLKEFDEIQIPSPTVALSEPTEGVSEEAMGVAETMDLHEAPTAVRKAAQESVSSGTERARRRRRPAALLAAAAIGLAAVVGIVWLLSSLWTGSPPPSTDLMILTEPADAKITLDGRLAGLTPIELIGLGPGEHSIRVARKGYETATRSFIVTEGETLEDLHIELVPTHGFLSLASSPSGGRVAIDGQRVGTAPIAHHLLAPGRHEVRVTKEGFQDWSMEVKAAVGESLDLIARLSRVQRPASSTAPAAAPATAPTTEPPAPAKPAPTSEEPEVLMVGTGITPPRKISGESPRYPPQARRLRHQGRVSVRMIITEEGVPTELEVIESAGPILDKAVLRALAQWRFEPAKKDGLSVRVRWTIRQSFRIGR